MSQRVNPQIEAIVAGHHGDPFAFLGMHEAGGGLVVRAVLPGAEAMAVVDAASGAVAGVGERQHPLGFFVARLPGRDAPFRYRLRASWNGEQVEFADAYS